MSRLAILIPARQCEDPYLEYKQRFFTRCNINVADHPPYSPVLNLIEHAWVLLKRQVTEYYPDLADTPEGVDALKARLAEVLPLC